MTRLLSVTEGLTGNSFVFVCAQVTVASLLAKLPPEMLSHDSVELLYKSRSQRKSPAAAFVMETTSLTKAKHIQRRVYYELFAYHISLINNDPDSGRSSH